MRVMDYLEQFQRAFMDALYFVETGDDDDPPSYAKIDDDDNAALMADCHSFLKRTGWMLEAVAVKTNEDLDSVVQRAGHDFLLTRNHHGAGFWEVPDWPEAYGKQLTEIAQGYGEVELCYDNQSEVIYTM